MTARRGALALSAVLALAGCAGTAPPTDAVVAAGAAEATASARPAWSQAPEAALWAQPDPGLLRAQDLAAAGLGQWQGQWLTDPEGGISECMRAAMDAGWRYPEVGAWGRLMRDGGAQLVQQSTARHADGDAAAADFRAHVAAVRACPTEEVVDWPGQPRVVLSVVTREVVEQSTDLLLARNSYACDTCDGRSTYVAVLRVGPWLTVLNLPGEPAEPDPAGMARQLMDAAVERLAAAG